MSSTDFSSRIVYEDNHLLIVDKLAGELAQGDKTGDEDILEKGKRYLADTYNKQGKVFLGLPHRLDRVTSGLLVLCRTSKALSRVSVMFRDREVQKYYHVMVEGKLTHETGELKHHLKKNSKLNKSFATANGSKDAKEARLSFTVLQYFDRYTLLEVELHTGRHHQIRAQFSEIGHPVKGDVKYGARRANKDMSICLQSAKVIFKHPVKDDVVEVVTKQNYLSAWGFN
jgi:23S rRNA pseudouridine1911/1915/1917 synthase